MRIGLKSEPKADKKAIVPKILQISDGSGSNAGEEVSIGKAITTDYLNLRSGAGLNHNVLTVLAKGAVVDVIDNSDGTWVKVKQTTALWVIAAKIIFKWRLLYHRISQRN